MTSRLNLFVLFVFLPGLSYSQERSIKWWNPAESSIQIIEGQGWKKEVANAYDRLPARAEKTVRSDVWNLSHHTAGLMIRFRSNSDEVIVRYIAGPNKAMLHMPATGVSGVDLYAISTDGEWLWCAGKYSMGDTIEYRFSGLEPNDRYYQKGREYRLYFPLYNNVTWMEIGVPVNSMFVPMPIRQEKPIVVYGTSIAQGGCASRPGMAWPAIVGRNMDRPVINLGFSGNGRLEKEVLDLITDIDAKVYVLDCLPNLDASDVAKFQLVKNLVIQSVKQLRQRSATTPILLTEHCGFTDEGINASRRNNVSALNKAQREAFEILKSEGYNNVFLLSKEEIGLTLEGTVDGIHPTDLGMQEYANGYEKKLRTIFMEPVGHFSTMKPTIQSRDANIYDWDRRHQDILSLNRTSPPRIVFFGNSITHFWGGEPITSIATGQDSWKEFMEPYGVRNFGYGWDRVENVLWRVYHDELAGYEAKQILILIGTNNINLDPNEEILKGLKFLIEAVKARQPKAEIILVGIYPRRKEEEKVSELNQGLVNIAGEMNILFLNAGKVLTDEGGKIDETLFTDGLHPNAEGYKRLAKVIVPHLKPVEQMPKKTKK